MILAGITGVNVLLTIVSLVIVIGSFLYINKFINKRAENFSKLVLIGIYLLLLMVFISALAFVLFIWGFDYSSYLLDAWTSLSTWFIDKIGDIVVTGIVVLATSFLLKLFKMFLVRSASKAGPKQKRKQTMLKVTSSLVNYSIKLIAILVVLSIWGVDVLPALAGLGILGLVIGLGAQNLIKDFIAGFFIIFEHHFDVGDIVEINGFKGEVVDIGLKSTRVRNWKQDIKIFANGSINDSINYSISPSVAIVEFGIAYGEDIQKTIDILNQELPKYKELYPNILENPVVLGVTKLADSSVNLTVIIRCATETHYGIERAIRQGIKEILDKNGIEIPFPQIVVNQPKL